MSKWSRAAEINRNLIIALVVLVIAAGLFWGLQVRKKSKEKEALEQQTAGKIYTLTDTKTGKMYTFTAAQARELNKDKKNGFVKVPETGEYTGKWGRGTGPVIKLDDEEGEGGGG